MMEIYLRIKQRLTEQLPDSPGLPEPYFGLAGRMLMMPEVMAFMPLIIPYDGNHRWIYARP